ncbi:zinc ribbon domain-containing protein [Virgibacillus kekensis]|uniref:Zinc ribbon domain-containing protein n=1 Tax=Virgibacillus kekensis TaxID=202261 RepID=A0ABV9DPB1_9BACI
MHCSVCGQESAEGKFCTNCGAQLDREDYEREKSALSDDSQAEEFTAVSREPEHDTAETMDKLKTTGANFWHFFTTLIKSPSEAKKANSSDLSSGIITIVSFSLIIALSYHLIMQSFTRGFFVEVTFLDSFAIPLVIFTLLFLIIAGLAFLGAKLAVQAVTFPDIIAKYGAYLVPFLLAYAGGALLSLLGLPALAGLMIMVSILGALFIAPSFILMEQATEGFDRIYVMLGMYVMIMLVFSFLTQSFMQMFLDDFMNMLSNGF